MNGGRCAMRSLVVALALVVSTVLVQVSAGHHLGRRGVTLIYRATGRAWKCWAFLSNARPTLAKRDADRRRVRATPGAAPDDERERRLLRRVQGPLEGYGKPQRQTSLIVDPPNGRLPPMTPDGAKRPPRFRTKPAGRSTARRNVEYPQARCISRGAFGSMLPIGNSSGNQIVQAPGLVVIRNEMIHEARIIP